MKHAHKHAADDVAMRFGQILSTQAGEYLVRTELWEIRATKAETCLIDPAMGDRVLVAWSGEGEAYVLSVLERKNPSTAAPLKITSDAVLEVEGSLKVLSRAIDLNTSETINVRTPRCRFLSSRLSVGFDQLACIGGKISARADTLKTVARHLETKADRVLERFKRQYRTVEEFEDSRVGRLSIWVKQKLSIDSESTRIQAREDVKVDAEKILLG